MPPVATALQRHYSPAEAARRLGVTVRALRVYERRGLVAPRRTQAGWRVYGPDQIARLHQVLALKALGLSLAQIAGLMAGRLAELDQVLALQERVLRTRALEARRGLDRLAAARLRLAVGDRLSLDDLTDLTRETTMTKPLTQDEWKAIFDPLIDRHYTPEERERAAARKLCAGAAAGVDQAAMDRIWKGLAAEARRLMARGDPASPEAQDLARRWMAEVEKFTGGDPGLTAKSAAVWRDAMADPDAVAKLPLTPEMFAFVGEAWRHARA